ncbi:MAG: glycosyltransferase family 2 protein [Mycobacteriales bacterium]
MTFADHAAAVVMPTRNCAPSLARGLAEVVRQATALGCPVVVVDDASTDGSARAAESAGARVLAEPRPLGPYAARNRGWRSVEAGVVVFVDARCLPRPGWLEALITGLLAEDTAAIAGGETLVVGGLTAAERWAVRDQRLTLRRHLRDGFLPYVPTANMAVRRSVLEALGGFREVRSGGDVDLCWRAELAHLGTVTGVPGAILEVSPRSSIREVVRQWHRYGHAHVALWRSFAAAGCPVPTPTSRRREAAETGRALLGLLTGRRRDPGVEFVEWARLRAYRAAYRRAWRRHALWPDPGQSARSASACST